MSRPPLEKISSDKLDQFLRNFFIEYLEYDRIDNDPDAENPRSSEAWRMVIPIEKARPFAIAYQANLSTMERRAVSRLYIEKVIKHRDGTPSISPVLYGFTDGARLVFFSADTARNRDDRFDINEETQQFQSVNEKLDLLHKDKLVFLERLARKIPKVDFLFDARLLSADTGFKNYMRTVREQLMKTVVLNNQALAAVVYYLLESPEGRESRKLRFVNENKELIKELRELHLELGMRLGDAIAAAVDTLILRCLMVRFLEAYHPDAMKGLLSTKEILSKGNLAPKKTPVKGKNKKQGTLFTDDGASVTSFTDLELEVAEMLSKSFSVDVSRARKKAKGEDLQLELFAFQDEETGTNTILEEEEKRSEKLGGDFYLADLGKAARAIEEALLSHTPSIGSSLIQDFLGRISNRKDTKAHWEFRYEDLRPQTLQDYYESSLGTAVQLAYNEKDKSFEIAVGESQRQRKELGAYYTDSRLCRYMVEQTVKPIFDERIENLRIAIDDKDLATTRQAFYSIVHLSICDPTMGSAPFLRAAFDYLAESTQYFRLCRYINECKTKLPDFYSEVAKTYPFLAAKGGKMDEDGIGAWELHILRQMLYGVDIDRKAVCIACQTFALSSMRYLKQGERFPSFFNLNLKLGNALISPVQPSDRPQLAQKQVTEIAKLIQLRQKARLIPNDEKAYEELAKIFKQIQEIKTPILQELVQEHVAPILDKFTEELLPFCWELEFPEVFFNDDGTLKENPGFDVMIGNPPWNNIKPDDREFFEVLSREFSSLKARVERDKATEQLLQDESINKLYKQYLSVYEKWNDFVRDNGLYKYQKPKFENINVFKIDNNFYKLTLEHVWLLTKQKGAISLLVPLGFAGDLGVSALRKLYLDGAACKGLWGFDENAKVFPIAQSFLCIVFEKSKQTQEFPYVAGISSVEKFLDLSQSRSLPLLTVNLIQRTTPETYGIPEIDSPEDLIILQKLYKYPSLFEVSKEDPWIARPTRDLHTTDDRDLFRNNDTGIPLLKGDDIEQFCVREPLSLWADREEYKKRGKDFHVSRVVWRDVSNINLERRMHSTLVPANYALLNSLNYLVIPQNDPVKLYLVGLLNSFVLEYRARQLSKNNHINQFVVASLPIPRLQEGDARFDKIASIVTDLLTKKGKDENKRAELDARIAHLYELTEVELKVVLSRFPKVSQETKDLVQKYFLELSETV